jgi:hypothetical protein
MHDVYANASWEPSSAPHATFAALRKTEKPRPSGARTGHPMFPSTQRLEAALIAIRYAGLKVRNTRRVELFVGLFKFRDDGEVFKSGGVAFDFAVGCEFAEQAAHDLA